MFLMKTWEKTNILNRLHGIELRLQKAEAAICRLTEIEPEGVESIITYLDLQEDDESRE